MSSLGYKFVKEKPFFWYILKIRFPSAMWNRTAFVIGNNIYRGTAMNEIDLEHEKCHVKQQKSGAFAWWVKYFFSSKFRFEQELECFREQYQFILKRDAKDAPEYLHLMCLELSGNLYGNLCSFREAYRLISGA